MLKESCGVFGIYAPGEDVARLTYFGDQAQQHRGQESSGIATANGQNIQCETRRGRVDRFTKRLIRKLSGPKNQPAHIAIGHTRYSNTGGNRKCNFQPIQVETAFGHLALAHNGNLVNPLELREKLLEAGVIPKGTSDSELITLLIGFYSLGARNIEEAIISALQDLQGAYSLVILTKDKLFGVRDPWGVRPLSLGRFNSDNFVLASETCALEAIGARWVQDINPGEMVVIDGSPFPRFLQALPAIACQLCVFEFIYFASPGSILYDRLMQTARRHMGELLWDEHPVKIDDPRDWVVGGVPDTGIPAAKGYAEAAGLEVRDIFIKNRYIGRTFIEPDQRLRSLGVRIKFQALSREVIGKKVVVVEDSIVRATTTGQIVQLLKEAGASEVHVRVTSPPYRHRCHLGIDTQYSQELIASRRTVEQIRQFIGADSLDYLSIEGVIAAINKEKHLDSLPMDYFCTGCFTGCYPLKISEEQDRLVLERA